MTALCVVTVGALLAVAWIAYLARRRDRNQKT